MSDSFGAMLGRLMQERRPKERLTQGQLAAKVWPGDSDAEAKRKGDISKIETGKVANPQATTVTKVADALKITDAEIAELRRLSQLTDGEKLKYIPTLSRDDLELLANRFEIETPHACSDNDLRQRLTKKAEEYRALKDEVDAIPETMKRLANLKSAAQDAIARVDLDEVENLMSMDHETELEEAAKSAEIRANNALLQGKVEKALVLFSSAADSFASVDPIEPARRRINKYFFKLCTHELQYTSIELDCAKKIVFDVITEELKTQDAKTWASGQNALAICFHHRAMHTEGKPGSILLEKAVTAARAALSVIVRSDDRVSWAKVTSNLANTLSEQGRRTKNLELVVQAVTAYNEAIEILVGEEHAFDRATNRNNLGLALKNQGIFTDGNAGAELFANAISAFQDALESHTRSDHPVEWAMWHENIARTHEAISNHDSCDDPYAALSAALENVDAALTGYDPDRMSYLHTKATQLRNDILTQIDALS